MLVTLGRGLGERGAKPEEWARVWGWEQGKMLRMIGIIGMIGILAIIRIIGIMGMIGTGIGMRIGTGIGIDRKRLVQILSLTGLNLTPKSKSWGWRFGPKSPNLGVGDLDPNLQILGVKIWSRIFVD